LAIPEPTRPPTAARHPGDPVGGPADLSAPLGSVSEGRLVFVRGAWRAVIAAGGVTGLYRAHFEGEVPEIRVSGGEVAVRYRNRPLAWTNPFRRPDAAGSFTLNPAIPWSLEFRHGVADLLANLSGLDVRSVLIGGGVSQVELALPRPSGPVGVTVRGGASHLVIHRPADVLVRVSVRGGVSKLAVDDQRFGAIGGHTVLRSLDVPEGAGRYDIEVLGGASNLTVDAGVEQP
jgi:hypothetical protein